MKALGKPRGATCLITEPVVCVGGAYSVYNPPCWHVRDTRPSNSHCLSIFRSACQENTLASLRPQVALSQLTTVRTAPTCYLELESSTLDWCIYGSSSYDNLGEPATPFDSPLSRLRVGIPSAFVPEWPREARRELA
ncbi:hypothetical protein BV25DRAFT_757377 [Artomyces pyxidatus]|uniref:Uncharacterized protein n=1 Tax=Artomyces pyxidatus TaxID=48021 RepID=A0ACB8SY57_9AGAM|nr:hypothetical protein BV25DRAFT_757377 [Artomyces pyxidatus]